MTTIDAFNLMFLNLGHFTPESNKKNNKNNNNYYYYCYNNYYLYAHLSYFKCFFPAAIWYINIINCLKHKWDNCSSLISMACCTEHHSINRSGTICAWSPCRDVRLWDGVCARFHRILHRCTPHHAYPLHQTSSHELGYRLRGRNLITTHCQLCFF